MPFYAICPYCRIPTQVDDEQRERVVACASCGKLFQANDPTAIQTATPPLPPPELTRAWEDDSSRPDSRRWDDQEPDLRGIGLPLEGQSVAQTTVMVLVALLLTECVNAGLAAAQLVKLNRGAFAFNPQDPLETLVEGVGCVHGLLNLVSVVVYLIWISKAYGNLTTLRVDGLSCTPGWAVGYYFIPFLNLVRPAQVMSEMWKASDPADTSMDSLQWKNNPGTPLIGAWWFFWLLSNVVAWISLRTNLELANPNFFFNPESIRAALVSSIAASVFDIFAGVFLIFLIRGVMARQTEKYLRLYGGRQESD